MPRLFIPLSLLPVLLALSASAQTAQKPGFKPDLYRSAFEGYRRFTDAEQISWKEANATVETIGGWRAYAKEAHEPQSPASPKPAPAASAVPHAGHATH